MDNSQVVHELALAYAKRLFEDYLPGATDRHPDVLARKLASLYHESHCAISIYLDDVEHFD